jgi:glycosyltransferase involved in cell wall biosynthesis
MSENSETTQVNPVLTVFVLVYNQKKFVNRCVDGVLMQKTNFSFNVIVHDDSSTDGTSEILEEILGCDSRLRVIRQAQNIYSHGACLFNLSSALATSRYVALVEGDDFWTDPTKKFRNKWICSSLSPAWPCVCTRSSTSMRRETLWADAGRLPGGLG